MVFRFRGAEIGIDAAQCIRWDRLSYGGRERIIRSITAMANVRLWIYNRPDLFA